MKKNLLLLLSLLVVLFSCQSKQGNGFTLKGQLKNIPADTKVYLEELTYSTRNPLDTAAIDAKGNFSIQTTIKNNGLYQLRIGEQRAVFLVLDEKSKDVKLNADTSEITQFTYKINGSPASEQLRDFIVHTKSYGDGFAQAMREYRQNVSETTADSIRKVYESKLIMADSNFRTYANHFVDTVKNPIIAIFAVTNLDYQRDQPTYEKLASRVRTDYAGLPFVQAYLQMIDDQKKTAMQDSHGQKYEKGMMAPEIELQDLSGKTLKLSSLKGNVVLLDFWASWCGPCRRENPNVVKAYQMFNSKGFTIYSVSLDNNKDKWTDGIKKDHLIWPYHVSDLQGWNSPVCQLYGIRSIPQNYLLDKEGKIIASDLRGEDLINTLQTVLQ